MKGNKKTNVIFTIDIRVSGQTMSIPVYQGENHQQLIQRFCQQHVFKSDYKQAIKDKIIESLMQTLKRTQISSVLKNKVNNFLRKNDQPQPKQKSIKLDNSHINKPSSENSTPFKQLVQHSHPSQSQAKSSSHNQHRKQPQDIQYQKSLKSIQVKSTSKPQAIRKNKPLSDNKPQTPAQSRSSISKNQDFDLISAYQVIYKKSKQQHMKNMAKKFLMQCGYFKNEPKKEAQQKRNIEKLDQFKKSPPYIQKSISRKSQQKLSKSHSPMKKYHQQDNKDIKNSDIQSFNNYEIVQMSRKSKQRSPSRYSPGKRNRIKYDIEGNGLDVPEKEKYVTQGMNLSRYENQLAGSSYRPQRVSVSYERLPYYHGENNLDISSYHNLPGVNEPQRAISLRRTRKYKYL